MIIIIFYVILINFYYVVQVDFQEETLWDSNKPLTTLELYILKNCSIIMEK